MRKHLALATLGMTSAAHGAAAATGGLAWLVAERTGRASQRSGRVDGRATPVLSGMSAGRP